MQFFLQGGGLPPATTAFDGLVRQQVITEDQAKGAQILQTTLPTFAGLGDDVRNNEKAFVDWVRSSRPESNVPEFLQCIPHREGERVCVCIYVCECEQEYSICLFSFSFSHALSLDLSIVIFLLSFLFA